MTAESVYRVRIAPGGFEYETDGKLSLLKAANRAGISLPSSCRNGTCRTCLCHLSAGKIHHTVEWPGLSAEEKREGWILPCVAVAESDVTLHIPHAKRMAAPGKPATKPA